MSTQQEYVDRVRAVERYVDGDTGWTWVDLGYRTRVLTNYRLHNLDTPELRPRTAGRTPEGLEAERAAAAQALELVAGFFFPVESSQCRIWQHSVKADPDQFGRWLCRFWREWADGAPAEYLDEMLLSRGLAVLSPGGDVKWWQQLGVA